MIDEISNIVTYSDWEHERYIPCLDLITTLSNDDEKAAKESVNSIDNFAPEPTTTNDAKDFSQKIDSTIVRTKAMSNFSTFTGMSDLNQSPVIQISDNEMSISPEGIDLSDERNDFNN